MPRSQCATNIPARKEVWSCARDEGRPLASGDQEPDANRCKLLPLRAVVVSVAEKAGPDPAVVCLGETSESKPSMNGRKGIVQVDRPDEDQVADARHRGGAARSRVESPVMGLDRRGSGILLWQAANR